MDSAAVLAPPCCRAARPLLETVCLVLGWDPLAQGAFGHTSAIVLNIWIRDRLGLSELDTTLARGLLARIECEHDGCAETKRAAGGARA